MPYTMDCASEHVDSRRFNEMALNILDTANTNIEATNVALASIETDIEATNTKLDSLIAQEGPYTVGFAVDYSGGDVVISPATRAITAVTGGALVVDFSGTGTGITLTLIAGQTYEYSISKVYQAGSAATIIGLR